MSLLLSRESSTESEVGGGGLATPHLSDFSVNYHNNNNNNSFSQDEGSNDGDRPNSVSICNHENIFLKKTNCFDCDFTFYVLYLMLSP